MTDEPHRGLWDGDAGTLLEPSRRALLEILKGPYLSGRQQPGLWAALMADERSIRSRLNDLFLELVMDPVEEFAFARKVRAPDVDAPSALRSERLTFIDTAMLLVLRQLLLAAPGEQRVIVGQDDVYERLAVYNDGDDSVFQRNLNGAWNRMLNKFRVLHGVGTDRAEISPIVRFLIDEERVRALSVVYQNISGDAQTAVGHPETVREDEEGGEEE
ncbi:hypothetical protein B7R21_07565 [Subtercola boreus]|uniref:DUF4194 domain-containing protein n=1 Tax=Subtercola boreus TaxID=120213 RepID=A0A3E0VW26_9MICO|nr:DUF4194 domain-containing protein [Subtercola boreus]RFA13910.1 hypothetical protein B7R21_07565 [Subtercola boreus]